VAAFDLAAARRWATRLDPGRTLARRSDAELPFVDAGLVAGQALLLDTCVYIDRMQDRTPQIPEDVIANRLVNHSMTAIQELMHTIGALDPSDARTAFVVAEITDLIKSMPPHRVLVPDADIPGRAALLSGTLCRLQGYQRDGRLRALHDCVLFLQAQKLGLVVLTANVADYYVLLRLVPSGRALFYRRR
jgi:hypothetical protein